MSSERTKYEFPIPDIDRRCRADAPAGIFLLEGAWHLAAHDSSAEDRLLQAGALLVVTLSFQPPGRPANLIAIGPEICLELNQVTAS